MTAHGVSPHPRPDPTPEFWEQHYRDHAPHDWGTRPNSALVRVVETHATVPGRALDLGCGHGGDALWLAELGWQVTAVDASATAIERVIGSAHDRGLDTQVTALAMDVTRELPTGPFDLVTSAFVHTRDGDDRNRTLRRAAALVAPGGLFVVIDHASSPPWSWALDGHVYPTPDDTLHTLALDGVWDRAMVDTMERTAVGPEGVTATVIENIVAVRRR